MKKKSILLAASLAMLLVTSGLALAQTGPDDEVRCLIPEGCGPVVEDKLVCFIPEGCDTNGDGVPDLGAGEPVPGGEAGPRSVQYDNTP